MIIKKTKIPIYKTRLILIESDNYENVVNYFKRRDLKFHVGTERIYAHTALHKLRENKLDYGCIYLVLNRNNGTNLTYGAIAHEAKHMADIIFERTNATYYDDEPHAYLVEYFVKEICEFLKIDFKIKRKKL